MFIKSSNRFDFLIQTINGGFSNVSIRKYGEKHGKIKAWFAQNFACILPQNYGVIKAKDSDGKTVYLDKTSFIKQLCILSVKGLSDDPSLIDQLKRSKRVSDKLKEYLDRKSGDIETFMSMFSGLQIAKGRDAIKHVVHVNEKRAAEDQLVNSFSELDKSQPQVQTPQVSETKPIIDEAEQQLMQSVVEAEALVVIANRVAALCEIAKQQIAAKNNEKASIILNKARKAIEPKDGAKEIESLCEIAKVRLLISPDKTSQELKDAIDYEENARNGYSSSERPHLLPLHAKKLCSMAEICYQTDNTQLAKVFLLEAKKCADANKARTFEYIVNLNRISKLQLEWGLLDDGFKILKEMLAQVECLHECAPEVTWYTAIIDTLISLKDSPKGKEAMFLADAVLRNATAAFTPYTNKSASDYSWWSDTKQKLDKATEALKLAKEKHPVKV